jgi:hypothetical protein
VDAFGRMARFFSTTAAPEDPRHVISSWSFVAVAVRSFRSAVTQATTLPVTWVLPGNLPHIGLVTDQRSPDGNRLLIVHNIGARSRDLRYVVWLPDFRSLSISWRLMRRQLLRRPAAV